MRTNMARFTLAAGGGWLYSTVAGAFSRHVTGCDRSQTNTYFRRACSVTVSTDRLQRLAAWCQRQDTVDAGSSRKGFTAGSHRTFEIFHLARRKELADQCQAFARAEAVQQIYLARLSLEKVHDQIRQAVRLVERGNVSWPRRLACRFAGRLSGFTELVGFWRAQTSTDIAITGLVPIGAPL